MPLAAATARPIVLVVVLIAACSPTSPPPTSSSIAVPEPSATRVLPASTPSQAAIDNGPSELVIWRDRIGFSMECCDELEIKLVKSGLFRLNAALEAVPDLAAEPCRVADDLITIDCKLREASFHDGTPFSSEDVAFTLALRMSDACGEEPCFFGPPQAVQAVETPDARTVRFVLKAPDPTFLTSWLPYEMVSVESSHVVGEAYAALSQRAARLEEGAIDRAQAALDDVDPESGPACEAALPAAETILREVEAVIAPRSDYGVGTAFDACEYAAFLSSSLARLAVALQSEGTDAIAAGYPLLGQDLRAVGTGPFRLVSATREGAVLEAYDGYHFGRPAADSVQLLVTEDTRQTAEQMVRGEGDVLDLDPDSYATLRDEQGVRIINRMDLGYFALLYNMRPGRLFEQRELRQALQLCVDKASIVDAATSGEGIPLDSPVPPVSWAYRQSEPVERDVEEGRRRLEQAGWVQGDDGVYQREGRRLSASVVVRADDEQRVRFVELVVLQAEDCGFDLEVQPIDRDEYFEMIRNYPHVRPGTNEPFDIYLGGWDVGPDPGFEQWYSGNASSEEDPDAVNLIGMSNPGFDQLFDEWRTTYDTVQRARLSRSLQEILLQEQPYLFGWSGRSRVAVSADLRSTAGALIDSPYWWWQLETLTTQPAK